MDVAKAIRPHVECPICNDVPRNGVIWMCVNGHGVCEMCHTKWSNHAVNAKIARPDTNAWPVKCPQCRGDFPGPPVKNPTVTRLIDEFPWFEWPCTYTDCNFKGTHPTLAYHEFICKQPQKDYCPSDDCEEMASFDTVVEHFGSEHKAKALNSDPGDPRFMLDINICDISKLDGFCWTLLTIFDHEHDWSLYLCSLKHNQRVFLWAWKFGHWINPACLVTKATLDYTDDYSITFMIPVYRMISTRQKVLADEKRLSPKDFFSEMITAKKLAEHKVKNGETFNSVKFRTIPLGLGFKIPQANAIW